MAEKVYIQPHWYQNLQTDSICFEKGGYHDPSKAPAVPKINITSMELGFLLEFCNKAGMLNGYVKMKAERTEDVKIIHRLLDLIGNIKQTIHLNEGE